MQNKKDSPRSVPAPADFSLAQTMESGQCFRYTCEEGVYTVTAGARRIRLRQEGAKLLLFDGAEAWDAFWTDYFALDMDYAAIRAEFAKDPVLAQAIASCGGIRILRQDPWESLCTFILSQNNHIPRIKKITEALCELLGDSVSSPRGPYFAFPSPERLATCTVEGLAPIRAGFRAKYLIDAADKVVSGAVRPARLAALPYGAAEAELRAIKGVGKKVAACVLLFGARHYEAFPVDTWISKALAEHYPAGFDPASLGPYAGIAQQYLFHYMRTR